MSLRTIGLNILAGMDGDEPRQIGWVEIDPWDYHRTLADGLRGMADQIQAMERDG